MECGGIIMIQYGKGPISFGSISFGSISFGSISLILANLIKIII
jgi:hypothetical protein